MEETVVVTRQPSEWERTANRVQVRGGYCFPMIVSGINYGIGNFVHIFWSSVWDPLSDSDLMVLPWMLLVEFAVLTIWVIHDYYNVNRTDAPISFLHENVRWSMWVAFFLFGCSLLWINELPWGLVFPTIAAVVDLRLSESGAITNAEKRRGGAVYEERNWGGYAH